MKALSAYKNGEKAQFRKENANYDSSNIQIVLQ